MSAGAGQPPGTRPRRKQRLNSNSAQTRRGNEAVIPSELLLVRLPSRFHFLLLFKHKDKCSDAKLLQESSGEVAAPSSPPTWGPGASQRPSSRPHPSRLGPQPSAPADDAVGTPSAPPHRTPRLSHAGRGSGRGGEGRRRHSRTRATFPRTRSWTTAPSSVTRYTWTRPPRQTDSLRFPIWGFAFTIREIEMTKMEPKL